MPRIPQVNSGEQIFAIWWNLVKEKANQVFDNISNITYNSNLDISWLTVDWVVYSITYNNNLDIETITDWTNTWTIQYDNSLQVYNITKS